MDTDSKAASGLPPPPGLSYPSTVPGLDVCTAAFVWGLGRMGRLEGEEGLTIPSTTNRAAPHRAPRQAALCRLLHSSAHCGCSPQSLSLHSFTLPSRDGCLCASEVLLVGAPSVWMRPGFYQARVPCRDWGRDRIGTCLPMGAAGTLRAGSAKAGLELVAPPATRPGAQGGASWALGAVTWAVTSGTQASAAGGSR